MTDTLTTDHSAAGLENEHFGTDGSGIASRATRYRSIDPAGFPQPTGGEEEWRFAALKDLRPLLADTLTGDDVTVELTAPDAVTVSTVARDQAPVGEAGIPDDRASAVAWASADEVLLIDVPANAELDEEVRVTITGTGTEPTAQHVLVRAGANSRATVVVDHVGSAVLGQNVEMLVDEGATLNVLALHDWDDDAVHTTNHYAKLEKDATLKHMVVTLGGRAVRVSPSSRFAGAGGTLEQIGLYFADSHQHLEHRLFVEHDAPSCTSRVTYKGALQGEGARAVWIGDVLIGKPADGTDTYELNRNLVLTEGARADSVPNLEIENGEIVGAGHASTTGRFDDEQLFYLMSRGIDEAEARRLVVHGFFAELIAQIEVESVRERLLASIERELSRSIA
jgi:Fe-S cluster assembly protein SufD